MKRSEAIELARNVVAEGETIGDAPEATAAVIVAALEGNRPWNWDPEEPELPKRIAIEQSAAVGRNAVLTADQRWPNLALDILPGHVWWPVIEAAFDAHNRLQAGELVPQDKLLQPALDAVVRERDGLHLDCLTLREKLDAVTAEKTRWSIFGHERNVRAASLEEALSRLAREAGVPDDDPDDIVGAVLAKLGKVEVADYPLAVVAALEALAELYHLGDRRISKLLERARLEILSLRSKQEKIRGAVEGWE